jgi:rod shape-determining protein MreD
VIRLIIGTIIFSLFGIILQGVVLHSFMPAYLIPNFLLILVVFLGFYEVSVLGVMLCFLSGIIFDLFSGTLLGPWAGSFVLVYVLLALFAQRMFTRSAATIFLSVFISNALATAVYFALLYQFQPIRGSLLSISLIESLCSALIAPLFFPVLSAILLSDQITRTQRSLPTSLLSFARTER